MTGASKRTGRGIGERLGAEVANLAVDYRTSEAAAHEVRDTNAGGSDEAVPPQAAVSLGSQGESMYETVREGRLVNSAGVVGQQGTDGLANDATTTAGRFGFTRTTALASERSTANSVPRAFVNPGLLASVPDRVTKHVLERVPLGRFSEVEDTSGIVRAVAREASSYMTGRIPGVNGGLAW